MRTAHQATAIMVAAALALSVAACSDAKPDARPAIATAGASPTPNPVPTGGKAGDVTPTDDNPLGIDWARQDPFTGPAADNFGAAYVMAAYREAVTFSLDEGYTDLMAKGYDARPVEFSFVKPYLTPALQGRWDGYVKAALAKDKNATAEVYSLTAWHADGDQGDYKFRKGQQLLTLGRSFSVATASLQAIGGRKYLVLRFSVSRNLRLMKDGKAVVLPLEKDITYRMTPSGLKDMPWLIDAWTISPKAGLPTPDPVGATP